MPLPFATVGTGLLRHVSIAGDEKVPAPQYVHDAEPGPGAYVPGGHAMHVRPPSKDEVPAGQGAHPVSRVKKPAGHTTGIGSNGRAGRAGNAGSGIGSSGSGIGNCACTIWRKTAATMTTSRRN